MENQKDIELKNYISEINKIVTKDITTSPFEFSKFEKILKDGDFRFNLINFFLLKKAIFSGEQSLFQILIPDKFFKESLLNSLLISVSIFKYYQNLKNPFKALLQVKEGDVFFIKSYDLCEVVEKRGENFLFKSFKTKQNFEIPRKELVESHKLRSVKEFQYTNRSITYFDQYREFYDSALSNNYGTLAHFSKKTIIISPSAILNSDQKSFLPFRYNEEKNDTVAVEPLIEVFNTYDLAREFLKKNRGIIDEVIIVGYEKYQDKIGEILNDRKRSLFKKLILIGSKKIKSPDFKFWLWTNSEMNVLSHKEKWFGEIKSKIIPQKNLRLLKEKLNEFKVKLLSEGVEETEIESINNYFISIFSQALIVNKANLSSYVISLFEEEDNSFDSALEHLTYQKLKEHKKEYLKIITSFLENFDSGKLNALKRLQQTDLFYKVIVPRREKNQTEDLFKTLNFKKHDVLTHSDLERIIREQDISLPPKKILFVVPHIKFKFEKPLWFFHLYKKALAFGNISILCYLGLEEKRLEMFEDLYRKQKNIRLRHCDREWFIGIEYPTEVQIEEDEREVLDSIDCIHPDKDEAESDLEKAKRYFKKRYKIISDKSSKDEQKENGSIFLNPEVTPESKVKYRLALKDNNVKEAQEYDTFGVKKGKIYEKKYVKELLVKQEIIIDWKIELKSILKILKHHNALKDDIREIRQAGYLWQNWLKGLRDSFQRKRTPKDAKEELFKRLNLSVQYSTFEKWLEIKDPFFFPKMNSDLDKIIELKKKLSPNKDEIEQKARSLSKGSTSLLFKIKSELTIYLCENKKGEILTEVTDVELKKLLSKKQINQIVRIDKL